MVIDGMYNYIFILKIEIILFIETTSLKTLYCCKIRLKGVLSIGWIAEERPLIVVLFASHLCGEGGPVLVPRHFGLQALDLHE